MGKYVWNALVIPNSFMIHIITLNRNISNIRNKLYFFSKNQEKWGEIPDFLYKKMYRRDRELA